MVNGRVYQLPNSAVLASDKGATLYIVARPFDFKMDGAFVRGEWQRSLSDVRFADEEIADKVIALGNPMLILQDGISVPESIRFLGDLHPTGRRYFVPTYPGSINPREGMGVLEQYAKEFGPAEIRVIGPQSLEGEMIQLREWIKLYWRIAAELD